MSEELQLFPRWKQSVQDFLSAFKYGEVVPHSWLQASFGLEAGDALMSHDEHTARVFEFLSNFDQFRQELLEEHQVLLLNVRGKGYRWVLPSEQTRVAMDDMAKDVRKALRVGVKRVQHLRVGELTDDERRENLDAQAKFASLKTMTKTLLT